MAHPASAYMAVTPWGFDGHEMLLLTQGIFGALVLCIKSTYYLQTRTEQAIHCKMYPITLLHSYLKFWHFHLKILAL